jgi:hypothetical protein
VEVEDAEQFENQFVEMCGCNPIFVSEVGGRGLVCWRWHCFVITLCVTPSGIRGFHFNSKKRVKFRGYAPSDL